MATGSVHPTPPSGPPPSQVQTAPALVGFDPKLVVPSQTLYFQRNDLLGFSFMSNQASNTLRINYRWLTPQGEIKEGELDTPIGIPAQSIFAPIYEGWLLSFNCRLVNIPPAGSWAFMQALIFRGTAPLGPNAATHGVFWQGFVTSVASNGWPGTPAKEITDGAGVIRSITGSTPAAGAEISETIPHQRRMLLLALTAQLTTSAAVANRQVTFIIDDGANILYNTEAYINQAAGTTNRYQLSPVVPSQVFIAGGIPIGLTIPFPLLAFYRIRTSTASLQAADQYTAPQYLVLEWGQWDT